MEVSENDGELVSNISTTDLFGNVTNLFPFTQYWGVVLAETVEVGEPSLNVTFTTSQDSKLTS